MLAVHRREAVRCPCVTCKLMSLITVGATYRELRGKEVVLMRCIKLVLARTAVMVLLVAATLIQAISVIDGSGLLF